jgi:hypothetical protein
MKGGEKKARPEKIIATGFLLLTCFLLLIEF